jgi:ubiquinone/menaquinone biosynthesis C-methylase UbiE
MSDKREQRLSTIVARDAMHWGNNVATSYHGVASSHMDGLWNSTIWPVLSRHESDLSTTMDFACGYGRNAKKLHEAGAGPITLVDVNPENIAYCEAHLVPLGGYETFLNNGFDLSGVPAGRFTHVYSFDAMVHFDLEIVLTYIAEFARVLKPLGTAFIHHSNFTEHPGAPFQDNPHWRNFMSDTIFRHASIRNGFEILEQKTISWGTAEGIDCITVMRRK